MNGFPESIVIEFSNSLEIGDVGFILLFLEAVIWLIIIYFTLSIIQLVRKVYITICFVPYHLKFQHHLLKPIIFSESRMLLPYRLFPNLKYSLKMFMEFGIIVYSPIDTYK